MWHPQLTRVSSKSVSSKKAVFAVRDAGVLTEKEFNTKKAKLLP
jgi:hypothetical protein